MSHEPETIVERFSADWLAERSKGRLGDAPDADVAVFGHHLGGSFSRRVDDGTATLRSAGVVRLDLRYHQQARPTDVIGGIARAKRSATEGSA